MFITAYKESEISADSWDFIEAVKVEEDSKDSLLEDFFVSYRGIGVECSRISRSSSPRNN